MVTRHKRSKVGRPNKKYSQGARLLRIYDKLLHSPGVTLRTITDIARVTERTARRDMHAILSAGVKVFAERLAATGETIWRIAHRGPSGKRTGAARPVRGRPKKRSRKR